MLLPLPAQVGGQRAVEPVVRPRQPSHQPIWSQEFATARPSRTTLTTRSSGCAARRKPVRGHPVTCCTRTADSPAGRSGSSKNARTPPCQVRGQVLGDQVPARVGRSRPAPAGRAGGTPPTAPPGAGPAPAAVGCAASEVIPDGRWAPNAGRAAVEPAVRVEPGQFVVQTGDEADSGVPGQQLLDRVSNRNDRCPPPVRASFSLPAGWRVTGRRPGPAARRAAGKVAAGAAQRVAEPGQATAVSPVTTPYAQGAGPVSHSVSATHVAPAPVRCRDGLPATEWVGASRTVPGARTGARRGRRRRIRRSGQRRLRVGREVLVPHPQVAARGARPTAGRSAVFQTSQSRAAFHTGGRLISSRRRRVPSRPRRRRQEKAVARGSRTRCSTAARCRAGAEQGPVRRQLRRVDTTRAPACSATEAYRPASAASSGWAGTGGRPAPVAAQQRGQPAQRSRPRSRAAIAGRPGRRQVPAHRAPDRAVPQRQAAAAGAGSPPAAPPQVAQLARREEARRTGRGRW